MIEFKQLSCDHTDLPTSSLIRAAILKRQFAKGCGAIGLTRTKFFMHDFMYWAAPHFE